MSLYKLADSDVWWASVTVNGERVRFSTGEYDRAAAQKIHDQRKAKQHDQPKLKGKKWSDAVMKWAEAETRSQSDLLSLRKFALHYPDRLLSSVTADSIDKVLKAITKTDGTYNRYATTISAILRMSSVAVKTTKRRDKDAKARTWLTHEQWAKLHAELPLHLKHSASFAVATGLRQANVLGLRWDHVDLGRRTAWVDSTDSKSGHAISIPLGTAAIAALAAVKSKHPEWCFTFRGKPYMEVKTAFQAACIRSGVGRMETSEERGVHVARYVGFTWHGLRHTWATWHAQAGTPLEVLQELGGWTDMRMLLKHYAHHVQGIKANYVDNIGEKK